MTSPASATSSLKKSKRGDHKPGKGKDRPKKMTADVDESIKWRFKPSTGLTTFLGTLSYKDESVSPKVSYYNLFLPIRSSLFDQYHKLYVYNVVKEMTYTVRMSRVDHNDMTCNCPAGTMLPPDSNVCRHIRVVKELLARGQI